MGTNLMSLVQSGGKFLKLYGDRKMVKTMPTALDYVQDGLIAMWDGIENAGWGVHDQNATVWKDLVGNKDMILSGGASFDDRSMIAGDTVSFAYYEGTVFGEEATLEMIFSGVYKGTWEYAAPFTRSDDEFSIYYRDGVDWAFKGPRSRPNCTPVIYKPLIATWNDKKSSLFYQDGTGSYTEGSGYGGGGNAKWSICGQDLVHRFVGNMYCVRIYNRVLSSAEIAANYAIDKSRFNLPTPTT